MWVCPDQMDQDFMQHPSQGAHIRIEVGQLLPTADSKDTKNYRPISLLPYPAKVIEKAINAQLAEYI